MSFPGFPKETLTFLEGITAHNEKAWFDANRPLYEAGYVEPGKALVADLGPRLKALSPGLQFEPRINGSVSRVNRDVRFTKDKRPYKEHLSLWFWHGDRRAFSQPGFWFQVSAKEVFIGTGMYGFDKEQLDAYRNSVIHPRSGKALLAAIAKVKKAGDYGIGQKTRKLMPRGFETDPDRAEYLLYEGLTAGISLDVAEAWKPGIADKIFKHFEATWPVAKWLLDEVV